jgi:aspartate racemase
VQPQHIGIVACSAEGAALCYRTICVEGQRDFGAAGHPEVSMHTQRYAQYERLLEAADWQGIADLMLDSVVKLARAGADFVICPDNTIHEALPLVEPRSPLPWLSIAAVVATHAAERGYRRIGLLGTRWTIDGENYPTQFAARGLGLVRPLDDERDEVSRIIMEELVYSEFKPEAVAYCRRVIERMKVANCDAVVLGCTELPLILNDGNSAVPTLDSTRLLARAALRHAAS